MDGWSPGYLGSIAYNHNGMMKMYETQSGRDLGTCRGAAGAAGGAGRGGRGGAASGDATPGGGRGSAGGRGGGRRRSRRAPAAARGRGAGGVPTGKGGDQDREWYRGIPIGPDDAANFTRRVNTNYMETGVLSALQLTSMFPATIVENFYVKTRNSIEDGETKAPFGFVIPVQPRHDAGRRVGQHPPDPGDRGRRRRPSRSRSATPPTPRARTSSSATSPTAGSPRTCSRSRSSPTRGSPPTTTAAGRWDWR